MKQKTILFFFLFCLAGSLSVSAQTAADTLTQYTGKWVGTFEGNANGKCELTLSVGTNGRLTGQVMVSPSEGDPYTATFQSVTIQGATFKAIYADPNGSGVQIVMDAKRTSNKLKGNWQLSTNEANGTWEATKMP